MSRLEKAFLLGKTLFTAEITPPKGAGIQKLIERAELLRPYVDAINITDCQRSLVRMSSLAASRVLLDRGFQPVFQLTCRDRNSIALQSDLMGAAALGIENVLCLTGDPVKVGDNPRAKSVFEMEALGLLDLVSHLQHGTDREGNKLNARTRFFVGGVVNPTLRSGEGQLDRLVEKSERGARFFQTQANYDVEDVLAFLERASLFRSRILIGVLLLHSYSVAEYIAKNIPGIRIPEAVLSDLRRASNPEEAALEQALRLMQACRGLCAGFHLMTLRAEHLLPRLVQRYAIATQPHSPVSAPSEAWS